MSPATATPQKRKTKPANMRGLFPRILKNGTTVWDVILSHNKERVCIGGYPTIPQARNMYQTAKALQKVGTFDPGKYQKRGGAPQKLDGPLTFFQHADKFLHERKTTMNHATWLDIKRLVHGMWKHAFGSVPVSELSHDHIKSWILAMIDEEIEREEIRKPQTRLAILSHLRHVLRAARASGALVGDPTFELDKLCGDPIPFVVIPLSVDEEQQFLSLVEKYIPTWFPFWLLLLRTGMRLGEALALKPEDLDFSARKIWVRRAWSCEGTLQEYTKTKAPRRIDMSQGLSHALKSHLSRIRKQAKLSWKPAPIYLFQGLKQVPYSQAHVRESIFHALQEQHGLRRFRIHDLRHTVACRLLERGQHRGIMPKTVQRLLGHASIATTFDIYVHYILDLEEFAVDLLDKPDDSRPKCRSCNRPFATTETTTHTKKPKR